MRARPQHESNIIPFPRRAGQEIAPRLIMRLAREIDEAAEQGFKTPADRRAWLKSRALSLVARDRYFGGENE